MTWLQLYGLVTALVRRRFAGTLTPEDVEDVVQTAFVRACQRVPADGSAAVSPDLRRAVTAIAVYAGIDLCRRKRVRRIVQAVGDHTVFDAVAATPDVAAVPFDRDWVVGTLAETCRLSPRMVLLLTLLLDGQPPAEVAGAVSSTRAGYVKLRWRTESQIRSALAANPDLIDRLTSPVV